MSVICSDKIKIGEGSSICAGNIITVNIEKGKHVIINSDCNIEHEVILGDYTTVLPSVNISGFVTTEECVNVGTGSAIIQGVSIGKIQSLVLRWLWILLSVVHMLEYGEEIID